MGSNHELIEQDTKVEYKIWYNSSTQTQLNLVLQFWRILKLCPTTIWTTRKRNVPATMYIYEYIPGTPGLHNTKTMWLLG